MSSARHVLSFILFYWSMAFVDLQGCCSKKYGVPSGEKALSRHNIMPILQPLERNISPFVTIIDLPCDVDGQSRRLFPVSTIVDYNRYDDNTFCASFFAWWYSYPVGRVFGNCNDLYRALYGKKYVSGTQRSERVIVSTHYLRLEEILKRYIFNAYVSPKIPDRSFPKNTYDGVKSSDPVRELKGYSCSSVFFRFEGEKGKIGNTVPRESAISFVHAIKDAARVQRGQGKNGKVLDFWISFPHSSKVILHY